MIDLVFQLIISYVFAMTESCSVSCINICKLLVFQCGQMLLKMVARLSESGCRWRNSDRQAAEMWLLSSVFHMVDRWLTFVDRWRKSDWQIVEQLLIEG